MRNEKCGVAFGAVACARPALAAVHLTFCIEHFAFCISPSTRRARRPAMTLIELLVVIVILTTLVAAAIPLLAPSSTERQLREASRGLNTMLAAAQARATAQGRPYGVALKRLSQDTGRKNLITSSNPTNDNGAAIEVFLVEQPQPYAGFDETSAVQIAIDNGATGGPGQVLVRFVRHVAPDVSSPPSADRLPVGWDPDLLPPGLLRPGDVIETGGTRLMFTDDGGNDPNTFDQNGFYTPNAGTPDGTLVTRPINSTGQIDALNVITDSLGQRLREPPPSGAFVAPYWTAPMPYKILRQPVPTSDEPYQLPEGTAIDLRASGVGNEEYFHVPAPPGSGVTRVDNSDGIIIMFAPEGRVWRVYYSLAPSSLTIRGEGPVVDNVYLLVGANVPPPPLAEQDPTLDVNHPQWVAAVTEEQKRALKQPINWLRGDSVWIVIGAASGRIATIENAFVDPAAFSVGTYATLPPEIRRTAQILAAREFTRDVSQLGGR
ncbi:MAG: type II secretion system protein [Pirellulales bacterium]